MTIATALFLGYLVVQRLGELHLARRDTGWLVRRGAREFGAEHYPAIVALHAGWIACLIIFGYDQAVASPGLALFAILQILSFGAWQSLASGGRHGSS